MSVVFLLDNIFLSPIHYESDLLSGQIMGKHPSFHEWINGFALLIEGYFTRFLLLDMFFSDGLKGPLTETERFCRKTAQPNRTQLTPKMHLCKIRLQNFNCSNLFKLINQKIRFNCSILGNCKFKKSGTEISRVFRPYCPQFCCQTYLITP